MIESSLTEEEKEQHKNLDQLSTVKHVEFVYKITNKINDYINDNILEILASMPDVNVTSIEEIQKVMEKVEECGNTNR